MTDVPPQVSSPWSLSAEAVAQQLRTDPENGLSAEEVERRQAIYGPNVLRETVRSGPWRVFFLQFADLMVALLAAAAVISGLIGEWVDAGLIAVIVLANAVIGFVQEWRAEQAVAALKRMGHRVARVRRDGTSAEISSEELVPGDVIEFRPGDLLTADARIVEAVDVEIVEAALSGESLPTEKKIERCDESAPLPDRHSMVYSGTAVMRGRGVGVVTATGMGTEIGRIANLLETAEDTRTPLQIQLSRLSKQLAVLVVVICVVIFVAGFLRESPAERNRQLVFSMLLTSVSLAVAAIPEGLPAVITVALAIGSQRMSRRKAIVRRLSAVETLGSVDVICTDKTGTLTQNTMSVAEIVSFAATPEAERALLYHGLLCSDVQIGPEGDLLGSATETAIVQAAIDRGLDPDAIRGESPRIAEIPFSSSRKRMSTLQSADDGYLLTTKGAAETVLKLCTSGGTADFSETLTPSLRDAWLQKIDEQTARGRRVLAVAVRRLDSADLGDEPEESERDLTLLGIVCIVDPIRPEAVAAIAECRRAGISPVMMTGDHRATAQSIASELNLIGANDGVMTGPEIDALPDGELRQRIPDVGIFARVSPEHKLRIVRAWQSHGRTVAMTGDGVNDAPALKQADIGVAMGQTGTDVAREASDMILEDDNFATIVAAVEEGRVVFDNIRKFVAYLLTANMGEIMLLLLAILFDLPLPLLAVHILWVNLVTDGLPAVALGFEPPERDTMDRKPRDQSEGVFSRRLVATIVCVGSMLGALSLVLFRMYLPSGAAPPSARGDGVEYARTMAFTTISISQLFLVLAVRSSSTSFFSRALPGNYRLTASVILGIALQLGVVYLPFATHVFHTMPLGAADLLLCFVVSLAGFVVLEVRKLFRRPVVRGVE